MALATSRQKGPKGDDQMLNFATLLKKLGTNGAGEVLRTITFVGLGYGCYQNMNVRLDAALWSRKQIRTFAEKAFPNKDGEMDYIAERARGYTFKEGNVTVDVFWYWDGDGTLCFRAREGEDLICEIVNTDCKHDYDWRDAEEVIGHTLISK